MKHTLIILIYTLSAFSLTAQISGEFKNFDPNKHRNIEVQVNYYSALDLEYIPIITTPDEDGKFTIDLPYKNAVDLCFFSIDKRASSTLVVMDGIHVTLDAKSRKYVPYLVSGKKGIFSGPDAAATIYFNNASNVAAKDYNSAASKIVFHSKDSAHIRSKLLAVAFARHQDDLQKFIKKHPSPYAEIVKNEELAQYFYHQMVIHWGIPLEANLLYEMYLYHSAHSSLWTGDFYSLLYNKLFYGDKDLYDHQTKITIWNLLEPDEREDFGLFFTEMRKYNNKEPYHKEIYAKGKELYIDRFGSELYSARLATYLKKIEKLPVEDTDQLLIASIPEAANRETYLAETKSYLVSKKAVELYDAIEAQDEMTNEKLLNMLPNTPKVSALGKLAASNTSVSMYHAQHDSLNILLNAIKQEYPNKVIILDIWGTWCGPCLNDIKKSKQKIAELKANNIEVVYLCEGRNSSKAAWMEAVLKMEMTENQIYMSPSLSSQFITQFKVTGYPSHIFIDTDGYYHTDEEHFIQNLEVDEVVKKYKK